jgi:hypothetical protein
MTEESGGMYSPCFINTLKRGLKKETSITIDVISSWTASCKSST